MLGFRLSCNLMEKRIYTTESNLPDGRNIIYERRILVMRKEKLLLKGIFIALLSVCMLYFQTHTAMADTKTSDTDKMHFDISKDASSRTETIDVEAGGNRSQTLQSGSLTGYLSATGAYNLYPITLSQGLYIQAKLNAPSSSSLDYDLYILNSSGYAVAYSNYVTLINGSNGTLAESVGYKPTGAAANYYICVASSNGGSTSDPYTLEYSISTVFDSDEPNENAQQPTSLPVSEAGATKTNTISAPIDNDWYQFTVPSGAHYDKVTLSVESSSETNGCTAEIYQNVSTVNAYAMARVGTVGNVAVSAGTYYVRVTGTNSISDFDDTDIPSYTLKVTPSINATGVEITGRQGTEGYNSYFNINNVSLFATKRTHLIISGIAYYTEDGVDYPAANTVINAVYTNENWIDEEDRHIYGETTTNSNGEFSISLYLSRCTDSEHYDTGVSYQYYDLTGIKVSASGNENVYASEGMYLLGNSYYHSH